ncbi:probable palmitoyltransferase ZDHHC24 [Drosophila erecta]|uniref:Palmitoyltransferase n=1 Tax=Drosophila erecta TaxID=7220 RepID=B3P6F3_DROER|nr:probable palmitoyltransferase ZDHHC24 [Drosophila erecta]EDV53623.1 uncharacterized protein Dere_GG12217 [Drosophila erecta]
MLRFRVTLKSVCACCRRMCFRAEEVFHRYFQLHRIKVVRLVHPFSAIFLLCLIGFLFVYELCYVLPEITDPHGIGHKLCWCLGIYTVLNILGNWCHGFMSNTSVEGLPPDRQHPVTGEAHLWHYCSTCQKVVPPRSWHCRLCNVCILKRDHHCTFFANCVGHNNQRYFLAFLFHLSFGSGQALVYNGILNWKNKAFLVSDPLLLIYRDRTQDTDFNWKYTIANLFKLNLFLFVVPVGMFIFQMIMVHRNSTCYEILDRSYDVGWRRNMDMVLGKRRFWIFFSPTIASPLPTDGTRWCQKQIV